MLDLTKVKNLTSNGSIPREPTALDRHYLLGYRWNTLLGYNAAVKKYQTFAGETGRIPYTLPLVPLDIYEFCCWAGRTAENSSPQVVTANTLRKYLAGIQMWHTLHDVTFPEQTKLKVNTMLKSSAYVDVEAPKKPQKKAVTIAILIKLAEVLATGNPFQRALFDLCIVAFWGMARLVELTYNDGSGPLRAQASLLTTDVKKGSEDGTEVTLLIVRGAKTADPGEEQTILLRALPHMLCPVLAVNRRLSEAERYGKKEEDCDNSLFGFTEPGRGRQHITRPMAARALDKIWKACGFVGVSGHSFRVGGASIQRALGMPVEQICQRGRWTSDSYKLYLRSFSDSEVGSTLSLISQLEEAWVA
jgi:hypothetical protein